MIITKKYRKLCDSDNGVMNNFFGKSRLNLLDMKVKSLKYIKEKRYLLDTFHAKWDKEQDIFLHANIKISTNFQH